MRVQGKLHERESGGAQHGEHGKQAAVADGKPCPEEQKRQKRKPQKRRGRLEAEADGQKQRGGIRGHKIKKRSLEQGSPSVSGPPQRDKLSVKIIPHKTMINKSCPCRK